jgi:16S rRNA (uracil1498-N3)-methyltransferase
LRVYISPLVAGEIVVRGDEHHYLGRVRRARVGDAVELVDGAGSRAAATIVAMRETETVLSVGAVEAIAEPLPRITALIPWIKGDRMDVCLEKLVEVGVSDIVVWPAARAVVKLDGERRATRIAHHQSALQAAARQCGRAQVPTIRAVDSLVQTIAGRTGIVLDPSVERGELPTSDTAIISGPEGGFAPAELDALAGWTSIGLGPRVLRAETAPVIAVALIRAATHS